VAPNRPVDAGWEPNEDVAPKPVLPAAIYQQCEKDHVQAG